MKNVNPRGRLISSKQFANFDNELSIGSDPSNQLIITTHSIAAIHATIFFDSPTQEFAIEPAGPNCEVSLNREPIHEARRIGNGDVIEFGSNGNAFFVQIYNEFANAEMTTQLIQAIAESENKKNQKTLSLFEQEKENLFDESAKIIENPLLVQFLSNSLSEKNELLHRLSTTKPEDLNHLISELQRENSIDQSSIDHANFRTKERWVELIEDKELIEECSRALENKLVEQEKLISNGQNLFASHARKIAKFRNPNDDRGNLLSSQPLVEEIVRNYDQLIGSLQPEISIYGNLQDPSIPFNIKLNNFTDVPIGSPNLQKNNGNAFKNFASPPSKQNRFFDAENDLSIFARPDITVWHSEEKQIPEKEKLENQRKCFEPDHTCNIAELQDIALKSKKLIEQISIQNQNQNIPQNIHLIPNDLPISNDQQSELNRLAQSFIIELNERTNFSQQKIANSESNISRLTQMIAGKKQELENRISMLSNFPAEFSRLRELQDFEIKQEHIKDYPSETQKLSDLLKQIRVLNERFESLEQKSRSMESTQAIGATVQQKLKNVGIQEKRIEDLRSQISEIALKNREHFGETDLFSDFQVTKTLTKNFETLDIRDSDPMFDNLINSTSPSW